ncbi:hypothetical protein Leryth_023504 [Lithospermum erythrorhizon]|nr:hypothetical protein Leryth_023504 [Lithospermum erythrorhizon]
MAKPAKNSANFPHSIFMVFFLFHFSEQLQESQYNAILAIKEQLNFPEELLSTWSDNNDLCNTLPNPILTLACYEDNITQLHLSGTDWFPHLPDNFSPLPLFSNLASLPTLKVLSLVSLGIRGALPASIGSLSSLEILNISSNYFNGTLPSEISYLKNLQTLNLDHNRFSGEVPEWVGSLRALSVLSLKNNSFSGLLPYSLSSLINLRTLVVASNNLSGNVPAFERLTNLQILDMGENNLGPQLPSFPNKLVSLVLRSNRFQFAFLNNLSSCYQLQKLDISQNELVGPFFPALFSMPSITYLDIAGNKLSGKLSPNISCNPELSYVNLSSNRLTGELPSCLESNFGTKIFEYGDNCLSQKYKQQSPYSFCKNEALAVSISPEKQGGRQYDKAVIASSMVGGILGGFLLVGVAFVVGKREFAKKKSSKRTHTKLIVEKVSPAYTFQLLKDARYISETMKLGAHGIPPYRTFVLDQLKEATNNFAKTTLIGEGPNRQVYKGRLPDGTVVAIRSLKLKKRHSIQSYTHQLELVSKLRHGHLVSAIGHCFECHPEDSSVSRIYLLFEFVPNGTLRSFISDGHPGHKFSFIQRIQAAIGVAKGIQFLHTGIVPGMYSNNLKMKDVLLDQDLHVKIKKYNLPLLVNDKILDGVAVSSRGSKETNGLRLKQCEKDDVYDFGVILQEIILSVSLTADAMGRRSIIDPSIYKECSDDSLKTLIELCLRCLSDKHADRPSIEDVIWNLQFAAQVQDSWRRDTNSNQASPANN